MKVGREQGLLLHTWGKCGDNRSELKGQGGAKGQGLLRVKEVLRARDF